MRLNRYFDTWRSISPDGDPEMILKLRTMIPATIFCAIHVISRVMIFVVDFSTVMNFSTMREQPVDVYLTVDRWMPFMGD
jgi:hypothetical protein